MGTLNEFKGENSAVAFCLPHLQALYTTVGELAFALPRLSFFNQLPFDQTNF